MRARIIQTYRRIQSSYWFVPAVLAVVAAVAAFVLVKLERVVGPGFYGDDIFFFAAQPTGARSTLALIGGSMIGVAGTAFSITIASVVFASGSYGPRLLTNFMNDRGNQFALGVFIATFIYALLVMRTVRDGSSSGGYATQFVPNLAIFGAVILAALSIGVLVYFLHHVPSSIHISNVIAGIGRDLVRSLPRTFPADMGRAPRPAERETALAQRPPCFTPERESERTTAFVTVEAGADGYIQVVDSDALMRLAGKHDLIVRLRRNPGHFVHARSVVFEVWPAERVDGAVRRALIETVALDNSGSSAQDTAFLAGELVEIAARALSPGVNDAFTAITCFDWLGAALVELGPREAPASLRLADDGRLRVIAEPMSFEDHLDYGFGRLRSYAAGDPLAAGDMIDTLGEALPVMKNEARVRALSDEKDRLVSLARTRLDGPSLERVLNRASAFESRVEQARADLRDRNAR